MRPKKCESKKARKKTLNLSKLAEYVIESVRRRRNDFDLGRYVSERIIDDFGTTDTDIDKFMILENQKEIDRLYRENNRLAERIKIRKEKILMDSDIIYRKP